MKKKRYSSPTLTVVPIHGTPLMAGSPLNEGETDNGGGLYDDEVTTGLSRHGNRDIWDDDEEEDY